MRAIIIALTAVVLSACSMPAAVSPPPQPTEAEYLAAIGEFADTMSVTVDMGESSQWGDAVWCAKAATGVQKWRDAVAALQVMPTPREGKLAKAWPTLQKALAEYEFIGGAYLSAADKCDPTLMFAVRGHEMDAAVYMAEVERIAKGQD